MQSIGSTAPGTNSGGFTPASAKGAHRTHSASTVGGRKEAMDGRRREEERSMRILKANWYAGTTADFNDGTSGPGATISVQDTV